MAIRNKALTVADKAHVRKTARDLRAAYDGENDMSEVVMLSSGYASVEIYPDDEDTAYVVRHGVTTSVPMAARRKTRKRKTFPHWSEQPSDHVPMTDAEFNRQADIYYAKTGVRLHRNPSKQVARPRKRARKAAPRRTANDFFNDRGFGLHVSSLARGAWVAKAKSNSQRRQFDVTASGTTRAGAIAALKKKVGRLRVIARSARAIKDR